MIKFIDYSRDYKRFKKEYDKAWRKINSTGQLILRDDVEEFEQRLAKYVGTKYAVALSSGTDAILLSLKALEWGRQEVALPAHTFKATCGAVINAGCYPVILDMGEGSSCKNQIVVHIAGELSEIPDTNNFMIIEDACQALGAVKNPTSKVQCWSFYPAKILGCKGDAGAITTNDEKVYNYIKGYRNHFKEDNSGFGGNHRADNLQCALLNIKIQHIDDILARRKDIAEKYLKELKDVVILPNNVEGRVWQDFIIQTMDRDALYDFLKKEGIETMKNEYPFSPEYPKPQNAKGHEATTLRIPCNENLTDKEQNEVIKKIKEFYSTSTN
jgi:UDP-2-acetamido-2-deoxy-ribo-hexuluronate aminotransferase